MIPPHVSTIIRQIAAEYEVTPADILSRRRTATISAARNRLYAVLRQTPNPAGRAPSSREIGQWLGRDGSTVRSGTTGGAG